MFLFSGALRPAGGGTYRELNLAPPWPNQDADAPRARDRRCDNTHRHMPATIGYGAAGPGPRDMVR